MEVRPITLSVFEAFDKEVKPPFFCSYKWIASHSAGLVHFGIYKGSELITCFHLLKYKRLGRRHLINPLMAPHCGLHVPSGSSKIHTTQTDAKRITKAMADYFRKHYRGAYFDFCLPIEMKDVQAFQWKGFYTSPKYTYLLNVNQDEDAVLKHMSTERRKAIRNAVKSGITVTQDENYEHTIELVAATLSRASVSFNPSILQTLFREAHEEVSAFTVYQGDLPIATAVAAHDARTTYYLAGGHLGETGNGNAGTLALWSAIREAQLWGCVEFDFLGSSVPPIEKFFRGFGAVLTPYFRVHSEPGLLRWLQKKNQQLRRA